MRNRNVWVVERYNTRNGWRVASIHYTRAAARRQRKRDETAGNRVRLQKYVPEFFERTLRELEGRVAEAIKKIEQPIKDLPVDPTTYGLTPDTTPTAGTLAGTRL